MNDSATRNMGINRSRPTRHSGSARTSLLLLVALLTGAAITALLFSLKANRGAGNESSKAIELSENTRSVLDHLSSPVTIRFYSILDPATLSPALFPFAERISAMLSEFQTQGNGRISVVVYHAITNSVAENAAADGLKPFNLDKGDACYFAIVVEGNGKRETLLELAPEWEPALEFDLSRAIERVARPIPQPKATVEKASLEADATLEVRRAIPDLTNVSIEDGTKILRDAAMKEFKSAVDEMGAQVQEAQKQLQQAQQSGSEADQQAAIKRLQQAQSDQAEKVKQIAARLDAQIAAFKQLKTN
jgi:uncharacterized protein (DUF2384 family)